MVLTLKPSSRNPPPHKLEELTMEQTARANLAGRDAEHHCSEESNSSFPSDKYLNRCFPLTSYRYQLSCEQVLGTISSTSTSGAVLGRPDRSGEEHCLSPG